ncbi:MAG: cytochrome C [Nitrospiraceae bacterium]|nr:MAG: cytochrome C [Nitrospiraceae bacterium]
MKKVLQALASATGVFLFVMIACSGERPGKPGAESGLGETLFKHNCAVCHPDGGNVINAEKTLRRKDLDANGIKKPEDIVGIMRNPGPGMRQFDESTIPDKDAKELAKYILKTFK